MVPYIAKHGWTVDNSFIIFFLKKDNSFIIATVETKQMDICLCANKTRSSCTLNKLNTNNNNMLDFLQEQ